MKTRRTRTGVIRSEETERKKEEEEDIWYKIKRSGGKEEE